MTSLASPSRDRVIGALSGARDARLRILVGTAVLAVGCTALVRAWVSWTVWVPFVVTALGAMIVLALLRRIGGSFLVAVLVAVAAPVVLMEAVGRMGNLSPLEAITRPLPMLLTSGFPAPVTLPMLVPGLVVAWAAGALIGLGLPRATFGIETLVAGVGLVVVGDLLLAGGSDMTGLISFGVVGLVLAYWATWSRRPGDRPRGLGAAALLGAIALAVGFVPLGIPYQPRDRVRSEVQPSEEPNPMQWLSQWAAEPEREILRRRGDPFALHLAVLPEYDGRGFYSTSHYVPLGGTATPSLPGGRFQVDQTVTVTWQPMSRWLPAPGLAKEVSVPDALHDPETGSLLLPRFPDGIFSYTVTGTIDAPRLHEVAGAPVPQDATRYTQLPELPPEMTAYAKELTQNSATWLERAQAIEHGLKLDRHFTRSAASGTSVGRLRSFLFGKPAEGGRSGTSEQFAASFVLLARSVGLPTRLAVGFGSGTPLDPGSGTSVVRGRDALAWPEVYFEGYGWVPFNPTPEVEEISSAQQNPADTRRTPTPRPTPLSQPTVQGAPPQVPPRDDRPWALLWAVVVSVVTVGGLVLARTVRTRRQSAAGALGAWAHVRDALWLAGRRTPPHTAATEVAADTGITSAGVVAEAAERASFAPPGAAGPGAWDDAVVAAGELRRGAPWWRRLLWWVNPQVFWRRR